VPSKFSLRYQYIGVIWNVCPPGGPVAARRWHATFEGTVGRNESGELEATFDPPGATQGPAGGLAGGAGRKTDAHAPPFGEDNLKGTPKEFGLGEGPSRLTDNVEASAPPRPDGWKQ
jgi:hypothetical protein